MLEDRLGGSELLARVDPLGLLLGAQNRLGNQSLRCGKRDRVRQIVLALGVVIADARQQPHDVGHAKRDRARHAQPDLALEGARILVLADSGHATGTIGDDATVAGGIGRFESQYRNIGACIERRNQ